MKTLHDSEFQRIEFDEKSGILYEIWKIKSEDMTPLDFQNEMQQQVQAARQAKSRAALTDTLDMRFPIVPEMQEWLNENIFPQFIELGMKRIAFLMSREMITQLSVEQTMEEETGSQFEMRYFSDQQEAERWLVS